MKKNEKCDERKMGEGNVVDEWADWPQHVLSAANYTPDLSVHGCHAGGQPGG